MSDSVLVLGIDRAARAVFEHFNGDGSWASTTPEQRSDARLAIRKVLAALDSAGLALVTKYGAAPSSPMEMTLGSPSERLDSEAA